MPRLSFIIFVLGALVFNCDEVERKVLLTTELISKSPTEVVVQGRLLDLPAGIEVEMYGHCWSEHGDPSVSDSVTVFFRRENERRQLFSFESNIEKFTGNRVYYFKSYVRLNNGDVRYGNRISTITNPTNGQWKKLAQHWNAPRVQTFTTDNSECGPGNYTYSTHCLFTPLLSDQDDIYSYGGYVQDIELRSYDGGTCKQPENSYQGWGQVRNPIIRRFETDHWVVQSLMNTPSFGIGEVAVSHNGLFYFGGGGKDISLTVGGFFGLYGVSDVPVSPQFSAFDPQTNATLPLNASPVSKALPTNFVLENKIYAIGGLCGLEEEIGRCPQDFVYDIALDEWKQIDPFPGAASIHMSAFVLDGRAYVGGGFKSLLRIGDEYFSYGHFPVDPSNEFYEYNPKTNTWRRLADFPGIARGGSFHFSLNSYGYLGCGAISLFDKFLKDFWRYDPIRDEWTQLADFPGGRRFGATATTLKNMGVAGLGVRIQESEPETVVRDTEHFFRVDKDVDLWLYDPNLK